MFGRNWMNFFQEIEIMDLTGEISGSDVIITEDLPCSSRKNLFEEFQDLILADIPNKESKSTISTFANYRYQSRDSKC